MSQQSATKVAGISENNTDANHFLIAITAAELRWLSLPALARAGRLV